MEQMANLLELRTLDPMMDLSFGLSCHRLSDSSDNGHEHRTTDSPRCNVADDAARVWSCHRTGGAPKQMDKLTTETSAHNSRN
jgi:hypothetical protein